MGSAFSVRLRLGKYSLGMSEKHTDTFQLLAMMSGGPSTVADYGDDPSLNVVDRMQGQNPF
jgi:hypothetical protein